MDETTLKEYADQLRYAVNKEKYETNSYKFWRLIRRRRKNNGTKHAQTIMRNLEEELATARFFGPLVRDKALCEAVLQVYDS
jgi:hypothetical protein